MKVKIFKHVAVIATLKRKMDAGEVEVIALVIELKDILLILLNQVVCHFARLLDLKVIRNSGKQLREKRKGVISEIKLLISALSQADICISQKILKETLQFSREN
ncbi:MAG: hypothetical protein JJP05_03650 [cyanobacterium endosymbiont of Rhopalodia gibba]